MLPGHLAPLQSVLALTQALGADLTSFDLFRDVQVQLEPAGVNALDQLPEGGEDVDIVFHCKKLGRFLLNANTDIGGGEGTLSIKGRLRNAFGGAETVEGSAAFGTRTRRAYNVSVSLRPMALADIAAPAQPDNSHRGVTGADRPVVCVDVGHGPALLVERDREDDAAARSCSVQWRSLFAARDVV